MEAVASAASVGAILDLTAKLAVLLYQFASEVKNAAPEIGQLQKRTASLHSVLTDAHELLSGPHAEKLQSLKHLSEALVSARTQVETVKGRLEGKMGAKQKVMKSFGLRSLKWPFESKEVEEIVANLDWSQNSIATAILIDQTVETFNISLKIDLSKLPVAKGAVFDSHANQHDPRCHPETRIDVLAGIFKWFDDPDGKCIYWLRGMAGTGKSTISRTVAQRLADKSKRKEMAWASFFFRKGEGDRGRAAMLFTSLATQLVQQLPSMAHHIQAAIEADPDIGNKSSKEQFEKLILDPLNLCKPSGDQVFPPTIAIVIDALDECDSENDITVIIRLLSRATEVTTVQLRFFLTSRPELPIRLGFQYVGDRYRDLALHDIPPADISKDISTFLETELSRIRDDFNMDVPPAARLPDPWPSASTLKQLTEMAVPLFIFASTACRFIGDQDCGDPEEQLSKIFEQHTVERPSQLHSTYLPILNQLFTKRVDGAVVERDEHERADILTRFHSIVGTIVLLEEPLTTASLARLIGRTQKSVGSALRGLYSVLNIPTESDAPVKMLHLSFRDFLVRPANQRINPFWVDEREIHRKLAGHCLELLSADGVLKQDICDLRYPGMARAGVDPDLILRRLPPEVQYACRYWPHHLKASGDTIEDDSQACRFLQSSLLHWLEALSLLGRMAESLPLLDTLCSLVEVPPSCPSSWPRRNPSERRSTDTITQVFGISRLLQDARRMILQYRSLIADTPLQLYSSALMFLPKCTFKGNFQDSLPSWQVGKPWTQETWGACLLTLDLDYTPTIVGFSSEGRQIVMAGRDKATIWDFHAGTFVLETPIHSPEYPDRRPVLQHHPKMDEALSPDGRQLACRPGNRVEIWDLDTGNRRHLLGSAEDLGQGLEAPTDFDPLDFPAKVHVTEWLAFSPDGLSLALVTHKGNIEIWNVDTGDKTATMEPRFPFPSYVTFLPDGLHLASVAKEDATVDVFVIATGLRTAMLTLYPGERHISISPNSEHLVTYDRYAGPSGEQRAAPVRLWAIVGGDITTAKLAMILGAESESRWMCESIAFSPDSERLAVGWADTIIEVLDTTKRVNLMRVRALHSSSLAWSPDSQLLLSVANQKIQVWDLPRGKIYKRNDSRQTLYRRLIFAPGGQRLVSISFDDVVELWDVARESQVARSSGAQWKEPIFCPDGRFLAYSGVARPGRSEVWIRDADTGQPIACYDVADENLELQGFSVDSRRLLVSLGQGANAGFWEVDADVGLEDVLEHGMKHFSAPLTQSGRPLASLDTAEDGTRTLKNNVTGAEAALPGRIMDLDLLHRELSCPWLSIVEVLPSAQSEIECARDLGVLSILEQFQYDKHGFGEPLRPRRALELSRGHEWVTWKGHPILWLPADYRCASVGDGESIAIGHAKGGVTFMKFSAAQLDELLGTGELVAGDGGEESQAVPSLGPDSI